MRRQRHDLRYGADVRIKVRERDPRQLRFAGMPLAKPRLRVEFRAFLTEDRANELLAWAVENQLTTLQIGTAEAAHLAWVKPATLVQVGKSHIFRIGFLVRVARALGVRVGIVGDLSVGSNDEE